MEIIITGDPVIDNLKGRQEQVVAQIKDLAYRRLQLTREIEELDELLGKLEGAQIANDAVKKDIDLRETITKARQEADKQKAAAEAAENTTGVKDA